MVTPTSLKRRWKEEYSRTVLITQEISLVVVQCISWSCSQVTRDGVSAFSQKTFIYMATQIFGGCVGHWCRSENQLIRTAKTKPMRNPEICNIF